MKFVKYFATFLTERVNLNQTRLDRLEESVGAIEHFLEENETFKERFLDLIPAGSWAYRTIIRPVGDYDEFDADVLLSPTENTSWQPKDYLENLLAAFRSSPVYKPLAELKTRCVRIDYECDFHIDVVPYLEHGGQQVIATRCKPPVEGCFQPSNPEAAAAWVEERQRLTHGHFIKVVRLVKYLRDYKNTFTGKSIILLTLLGNQVSDIEEIITPGAYADVPSTLVTLMRKLADALPPTMPSVLDPGGTGDDFSERYKDEWDYANFRKRIRDYADWMADAYQETDRDTAIDKWQRIFGEEFDPDSLTRSKALEEPYPATLPWTGEEDISKSPYSFPLRLNPLYKARITGQVAGIKLAGMTRRNGFPTFALENYGNKVRKGRSLEFHVTTTVPKPFQIYWKVRNGGADAFSKNALRGEISQDDGRQQKTESTLYRGKHYVECYVVKDGVVVAKDHQTVIIY